MSEIFDGDGNLIADIPVSHKQLAALADGAEVAIIFHTPQRLRYALGERHGSFSLRQLPTGRVISREPLQVKKYAELREAIAPRPVEKT